MTRLPHSLAWHVGLQAGAQAGTPLVVARGAGHDRDALRRAERLGLVAGAALHVAHGRLETGPARRGPMDQRPRLPFAELLALARPSTPLMLDLRGVDPRLPRLLARALIGRRGRDVIVCSRAWWMLEPLRGRAAVRVVPTVTTARQLVALLRRCGTEPLDGVAVEAGLVTAHTAAALGAMARMLLAWPVDSPAEAQRLRSLGVTGLISDCPTAVSAAVREPLAA